MKPERLQLDYIAPLRRPRWIGLLLLAVSLGIAGDLVLRYREAQMELQRLETARGLLGSGPRPARAIPKERLDEHLKAAQATIRQLALPWGALMRALESTATEEVSILQIQPDANAGVVRLTGEARGLQPVLEYMKKLGAAPGLSEVHLLGHQVREDEPQRPVQFTLQASFRRPS